MPTGAGISLATMRANVLQESGLDATDLDATGSTNLDLCINKSWWEIADKFDFREKETFTDFSLTVGQGVYVISTVVSPLVFDCLRNIGIKNPDSNQFEPLNEISNRKFLEDYNTDTSLYNQPEEYARDSGSIYFWPYPDQTYTARLYHLQILADVPSGGPVVPQSWHEIIEMGGVYRAFLWVRDYNSASNIRRHQLSLIKSTPTNKSKEDRFNKMVGVSVPTRPTGRRY